MQDNQEAKEESAGIENDTQKPERKFVIHTMPKRFLGARPQKNSSHDHKEVGIIILLGGVALLIGVLLVLYFFILRPADQTAIQPAAVLESVLEQDVPVPVLPSEIQEFESIPEEKTGLEIETSANAVPVEDDLGGTVNTQEDEANTAQEIDISSSTAVDADTIDTQSTVGDGVSIDKEFITVADMDNDGLNDLEEALLDCNANTADSDGDGFSDFAELMDLYNPAGAGKLILNPNIEKYSNYGNRYSIYYPSTWLFTGVDGDNSILFQTGNAQYVQIITQDNPDGQSLENWYKEQFAIDFIPTERYLYKTGFSGFKSADNLIVYLQKIGDDKLFILSYNTGLEKVIRYRGIFDMIVESFEL